ncbi:hypothetical protein H6G00_01560 [Leptolyngbya sp. FACHB-541]|uniref:hypothetical protein n=1 Tax=Leptolyngbya sp. FACHB-541 TaxID=2692810 RepID=UPI0016859D89|nr:hypothetical protein [Leptolyngbya sp. FACHB-541]MBD1995317.1 hypothetical protein [Leptolyngbya sp. FACHB-541]
MPLNLQTSRARQQVVEPLAVQLIANPPLENDTADTIVHQVATSPVAPPAFTVAVNTTNDSNIISGADLSRLRPGDAIAHANITGSITAVDLTVTPHQATVSTNATATGAIAALNVTPPSFNLSLYQIVATHQAFEGDSAGTLYVTLDVYATDGINAADSNGDGKDNTDLTTKTQVGTVQFQLVMDTVLANARVPRT